jgi:hypothetical protein
MILGLNGAGQDSESQKHGQSYSILGHIKNFTGSPNAGKPIVRDMN